MPRGPGRRRARDAPRGAPLHRALARDALYRQVTSGARAPSHEEVEREVQRRAPHGSPGEMRELRRAVADSLQGLAIEKRAAKFLIAHLARKRVVVDSL